MGKRFWIKHLDDESRDEQPGCMWGLVHILDYHHWQSNVRKTIHYRKYEGGRHDKCDWSSERSMYRHDACEEVEKLLDEKQCLQVSTKRSPATRKRSLKARIKATIAEEISKEYKIREKGGLPLKPSLQRTYSIHHLESVDDGSGKICTEWKHPISFLPRNTENGSSQSYDTTQMKAAGNMEASKGEHDIQSPRDAAKLDSKEDPDVFEIFKVDKELFLRHLHDSNESIANFSRTAFGLNMKAKFRKSRSFPIAEMAQRRKLKPIKLESKQKEVWSFPRDEKFRTVNLSPRLDGSGNFSTSAGELVDDEGNGHLVEDMQNKQDEQRNDEVIVLSEIGSDMVGSGGASLPVELNKLPDKYAMDKIGEKNNENGIRKHTHRRSYSLNESLDKYAWLFERSFGKDAKLSFSKSLKLTNEYGHTPLNLRKINVLSNADVSFEVLGDNPSANDLVVIAKPISSSLQNSEEEKVSSLLRSDKENMPLNAEMQMKEDYESLRLQTRDCNRETVDGLKEEAEKLRKSDFLSEKATNCPNTAHKDLEGQGLVLDSDINLQETESHVLEPQISQGLELGSGVSELNSSIGTNDLKSLQDKTMSTHSALNLHNDEMSDKIINLEHDGCPKKKNSDLDYVRHLLDQSGIAVDATEMAWLASDQPFGQRLFEEIEAGWPHEEDELNGWPDFCGCWHHQMLFDLVNEVLFVYHISIPYYPKALSSSCHVRRFPVGNHIIEEVCKSIGTLLDMKPEEKQSLDGIVARDLAHGHSWMNLQLETEFIALDIEEKIFNELLQEVIFSWAS